MKSNFKLLFCFLIVSFYSLILPQEENKTIIVNSVIGDTLSLSERNYYQLFPQIDGFQWAVFFLNSDSTLNANVRYIQNGILKDTLIENYRKLKTLNYHIYARNALENGTLDNFHSVPENSKYKKGSEVCAYMNDGRETSGEILSVRKSSILILKPDCDENLNNLDCVFHGKTSDIDKLVIKGNSNLGLGIGLGVLTSFIVGVLVFQSYNDGSFMWGSDAILPTIASAVGCITLGTAIGIFTSTPDEVIKIYSEKDIRGLRSYSRYPDDEPSQLKKIE